MNAYFFFTYLYNVLVIVFLFFIPICQEYLRKQVFVICHAEWVFKSLLFYYAMSMSLLLPLPLCFVFIIDICLILCTQVTGSSLVKSDLKLSVQKNYVWFKKKHILKQDNVTFERTNNTPKNEKNNKMHDCWNQYSQVFCCCVSYLAACKTLLNLY